MIKKTLSIVLAAVILLLPAFSFTGGAVYNKELNDQLKAANKHLIESEAFYLAGLDSGKLIFEKDSTVARAPASLTKIATAIVALENCKDVNTETVTLTQSAMDSLAGTDSSLVGLKVGESMSMLNYLYCLLVSSGNEAAMAIAEHVGGTIENFVAMMNEAAKKAGCTNTHFVNPHGLDEDGHYSCPQDIALLAAYAMKFPVFEEITSTSVYKLPATNMHDERTLTSTNYMMNPQYDEYYAEGVKGIKTGSTSGAGRCICALASRNGYEYICVVMGGPYYDYDNDGYNENFAFIDARKMLSWAFTNMKVKTVADTNTIAKVLNVKYARKVDHLRLVADKEYTALVPASVNTGSVLIEPVDPNFSRDLRAPIKQGKVICEGKVMYAGEEILRVNLIAAEDVPFNLGVFFTTIIRNIFSSPVMLVIVILLFAAAIIMFVVSHKKRKMRRRGYDSARRSSGGGSGARPRTGSSSGARPRSTSSSGTRPRTTNPSGTRPRSSGGRRPDQRR